MDTIGVAMRINEILKESLTDLVAHYYPEADPDVDNSMNITVKTYQDSNAKHYTRYFEEFYKTGCAPFINGADDDPDASDWTTKPQKDQVQSPGYRGREYAKFRAGQKYDKNVQPYATRQRFDFDNI